MNTFINIMNKIVLSVDNLINSISPTMAETIKRGFFFILFLLAIVAGIVGSNLGKEAATIEGEMIVESTNEAFRYTIKREQGYGSFEELVESELISEPELFEHSGRRFEMSSSLEPEADIEIMEAEPGLRKDPDPGPERRERPEENLYSPSTEDSGPSPIIDDSGALD